MRVNSIKELATVMHNQRLSSDFPQNIAQPIFDGLTKPAAVGLRYLATRPGVQSSKDGVN